MELATEIGQRVETRFGDTVLFGRVTGSVARGDDTPRSDLDTLFLTRERIRLPDMSPDGYREFLFRGLKAQIEFRTVEEAREILRNTGPYWPFQVKDFLEPTAIYGDRETIMETTNAFRDLVASVPEADFRRGAGHALMWTQASHAKIEDACEAEDLARAVQGTHGMGHDITALVALANRRYYRFVDLRLLQELESFPMVPRDYKTVLLRLYLSKERGELMVTARALWKACSRFAKRQNVRMEQFEELESVVL